jgi:hypothetical protein
MDEAYMSLVDDAALIAVAPDGGDAAYDFVNLCLFLDIEPQATLGLLITGREGCGMIGMVFFDDNGIPYLTEKGAMWLVAGKVGLAL